MGEAKRRRLAGENPRVLPVEIRDPTEHPHIPGTITVHVLHDCGATLTGSVPLDQVTEVIRAGEVTALQLGAGGDARKRVRAYIDKKMRDGDHLETATGNTIITAAMWLAWHAPEPHGAQAREALRSDHRLVLAITSHTVHGLPAINGRTMVTKPDIALAEVLQAPGMGPSTEVMTRTMAPH